MTKLQTTTYPLTVCVDCTIVYANDEAPENPDREPWGLLPDADVAMGMVDEAHTCGDPVACRDHYAESGSGCERDDFSTAPCDTCGTMLAGERYGFTLWGA